MRLLTLLARLTGRIYFVYWDEVTHRYRLYFDKADRDTRLGFLSFPWFGRKPR